VAASPGTARRLALHISLLLITLWTTGVSRTVPFGWIPSPEGWQFAFALLAILLAHEMGHYVFSRIHRVDTSLPYFLPGPPGFTFGTFGAFIRMRSPIETRDALVDIGASGPIAGALVALPLLVVGLRRSRLVPAPPVESFWFGHNSGLNLLRSILHGTPSLPEATHVSLGDNLLMRIAERLVLGPIPQGQDVYVHSIALAAWFGLLVTSLNLFPIGQLDGGHVTFALLGPRHRLLGRIVGWALLLLAFLSSMSWAVWWLLTTRILGLGHPPVRDPEGRLGPLRIAVCVASLLLFVLTFMPVPMDQF
jgi:membrane-associated protease RseP (regulator of RpoE activity)